MADDSPELIITPEEPELEEVLALTEPTPEDKSIVIASDVFPEVLLVAPMFDRPLFPKMMVPVMITDDDLEQELLESFKDELKYLGLVFSKPPAQNGKQEGKEQLAKVGVLAKIVQASRPQADAPLHIIVQVEARFDVVEVTQEEPVLRARVRYWYETEPEVTDELKAYSISIINIIKELVQLNPLFKEELGLLVGRINLKEPGTLSDFASSMTTASGTDLQKVLETRPVKKRLERTLALLHKELELAQLQSQINQRIEDRMSQQQREFFLREQLKEIKKELGISKEGRETEVEKYQARLKKLKLTDEAKERIDEELDKLKVMEPASPEYNVSRTYLDWLTILPWGVYSKDYFDIKRAKRILDREHYGLQDVKDRILELISVGIIHGDLAGSILLLVGPPGVGKTSVGQSIAKALGRKFYRFSLGGMRDEAEIKGHRRTYIGSLPGKFINALKTTKTANPVIMLDEVDKIGASFHGDPASALLEVLDPEQNKDFLDHYLDIRFDLSKVLFICTANQLDTIPGPLVDRMETIRLSGYILEEKLEIARRHLIPKQLKAHGITRKQVSIRKPVLHEIIDGYAREAGVRGLENQIKKLLRKSARKIVEEETETVQIATTDLPDLLGQRTFAEDARYKEPRIGVVTGLAYTSLGGATMHIEASHVVAKNAGYKQTGQLGKVMIESSEIAYTYVRSLLEIEDARRKFFNGHRIHLHVPAGATPKDGPSAGITMACALYSLATKQPIAPDLAMTGELTLTGMVMPIGGVKEKTIAARRAEVRELIFPEENRKDFEELDESIREGMTPHFVKSFDEVLKIGFSENATKSAPKSKPVKPKSASQKPARKRTQAS